MLFFLEIILKFALLYTVKNKLFYWSITCIDYQKTHRSYDLRFNWNYGVILFTSIMVPANLQACKWRNVFVRMRNIFILSLINDMPSVDTNSCVFFSFGKLVLLFKQYFIHTFFTWQYIHSNYINIYIFIVKMIQKKA